MTQAQIQVIGELKANRLYDRLWIFFYQWKNRNKAENLYNQFLKSKLILQN